MVKVSVIMPVYNAETFLKDSINSILNQSLHDLELICVDDGSTDNSLSILSDFEKNDSRVKVFSLKHQGGGNARNYALTQVVGEYLYLMDADDILDLDAFRSFYVISKSKNLDFLIFKAINYDVDEEKYYETEYYNMSKLYDAVNENIFNFKDIARLIFNINVTPWCKFYNTQFIRNSGAKFRENSKFHDNQFFWDIIFQAKRIYFLDEFYYIRTRHSESLTGSGDKNHIDIIGVTNDIIKLFIKHNQFDNFKSLLLNKKVVWTHMRYLQIKDEFKELFYNEIKNDFESIINTDFSDRLWWRNKFVYDSAMITDNHEDFDLLIRFLDFLRDEELTTNDKISKIELWFNSLEDKYKSYFFENLQSEFKGFNNEEISTENSIFYNNIIHSADFIDYADNSVYKIKMKLDSIIVQEDNLINHLESRVNENNELLTNLEELNPIIDNIYKQISELMCVSNDFYSNYYDLQKLESLVMKNKDLSSDLNNFKSINVLKDTLISDLAEGVKKQEIHKNNEFISEIEGYKSSISEIRFMLSKLTSENKYLIRENANLKKLNSDLIKKVEKKSKTFSFLKKR